MPDPNDVGGVCLRGTKIRIGFWGPLYYNYKKNPQNSIGNY